MDSGPVSAALAVGATFNSHPLKHLQRLPVDLINAILISCPTSELLANQRVVPALLHAVKYLGSQLEISNH